MYLGIGMRWTETNFEVGNGFGFRCWDQLVSWVFAKKDCG